MTGSEYKTVDKSTMTKLTVACLPSEIPDLNSVDSTKDNIIAAWLQNWIKNDLSTGKISTGNLLPQKADIAKYLGVSIGTVQNAIRYIEDNGYVESKQRIGTMVKDLNSSDAQVRKQTSKRDRVIASIKKLIIDNNYTGGYVSYFWAYESVKEDINRLNDTLNEDNDLYLKLSKAHQIVASLNDGDWAQINENSAYKPVIDTYCAMYNDYYQNYLKGVSIANSKVSSLVGIDISLFGLLSLLLIRFIKVIKWVKNF